jgi:hypothetical protein
LSLLAISLSMRKAQLVRQAVLALLPC